MKNKIEYNSLSIEELQKIFIDLGEKKYRAEQFFRFIHQQKKYNIEDCK